MSAAPNTLKASAAGLSVEIYTWGRGQTCRTFRSTDRELVQRTALACYEEQDAWLRDPSYPTTYQEPDGRWAATVMSWSAE